MRLLYCGSGWLPIVDRIAARLPAGASIGVWDRVRPLAEAIREIDVALPSNSPFDGSVIAAAKQLRLIQQPAAGTENIARAAATARGIPVCNAPDANHLATAEHAVFLVLALARRAPAALRAFANREIGVPLGIELAGRTLGIVGMGRIGSAVAARARGLGMTVIALGRGADRAQRAAFFGACDAISLHCPLDTSTRGLVDAEAFAAMRPGALLVNCARGGVIDRDALIAALPKLGGVALDVHWDEPADPQDPLYSDPRVLAMPHVAGSTEEAFDRVIAILLDNLGRLDRGEPFVHRVA